MKRTTQDTKRGAASLFVVIITIILLGVVTLGFTRLILSEANQISNSDLSQSAYDSALAGIEDAKIALLKYHDCLSKGATKSSGDAQCQAIVKAMQDGIESQSCDTVSNVLGREQGEGDASGGEVIVQETQNSTDEGSAEYMAQAYTCVTIQEELADYRTTLNSSNRLRIIPLRTDQINELNKINVQWFSDANATAGTSEWPFKDGKLPPNHPNTTGKAAPLLSVQLIQADRSFNLSELSASNDGGHTDIGLLYLAPSNGGENETNSISASEVAASANKAQVNEPKKIHCEAQSPFYCGADIELPRPFRGDGARNEGATFLIVGIPYGAPDTDISITLRKNGNDEVVKFDGVQAKIDSTGRANDLYRRVENRVELVDTNFPYPEFTIQLTGGADSVLEKNFWITNNCWTSSNGASETCSEGNNGTTGGY